MAYYEHLPIYKVSIHAPAWGATRPAVHPGVQKLVSIHAPAWGATRPDLVQAIKTGVSIHAPAWGATVIYEIHDAGDMFQSTLPHGERLDRQLNNIV